MPTVDQAQPAAAPRVDPLEFETLLARLSSRFVDLPPGDVDREIEDGLRRVCEFVGVDLAVLWQWLGAAPGFVIPTHTYCVDDRLRPSEPMRESDYPWAVRQVLAGRLFTISSLDDYPAEAAVDRETVRRYGVKAGVCLPLMVGGGRPIGALGFNVMRGERDWPDALVNRLQLIAQVFPNALARRRADEALRDSEEVNRATFEQAAVGLAHVGTDGRWLRANDKLCAIVGYPREELLRLAFPDITHPDDLEADLVLVRALLSGRVRTYSKEKRYIRKDRSAVWINLTVSLARTAAGEPRHFIAVVEDITERKRAEDELRSLSRRLIRAQEEERALLARELHDDVTQRLAVLAIDAGRAELAAPGAVQAEAMRNVREGLVRLSEDVHSLAYQLHPSVLEELGLAEALRTECERRGRQGGVALSLDLGPLPPGVERDAALCLFRVAQEALNNVIHHARAHAASVVLRQMDGGLLLAVRDDGDGFDPASHGQKRSLGLASMRERLRLVNGTLEIESALGQGTVVVAWVPGEGPSS
jgi:PAS domain S-box-containing protein